MGRRAAESHADVVEFFAEIEEHEDARDAFVLVKRRIERYRSAGRDVPEELMRVERHLEVELMAASQGR